MAERVTADELARMAGELRSMSAGMNDYMYWFGGDVSDTRDRADDIFANWFGPRADAALDGIANYLDVLDTALPAVAAQITIVDAMATFAKRLEPDLRAMEEQWASNDWWLSEPLMYESTDIISAEDFNARVLGGRALANAAQDEMAEISARWVCARNQWCDWSLPKGNAACRSATTRC